MWWFSYYTLVGKALKVHVSVIFTKMCWTPEHLKTDKYKIRSTLLFHVRKMVRSEMQKFSAFSSANDMTIIGSRKSLRQEKVLSSVWVSEERKLHTLDKKNH